MDFTYPLALMRRIGGGYVPRAEDVISKGLEIIAPRFDGDVVPILTSTRASRAAEPRLPRRAVEYP